MTDISVGGIASASSQWDAPRNADKAFDKDNTSTYWMSTGGAPQWLKYDLGSGNAQVLTAIRIYAYIDGGTNAGLEDYIIQGSNDDSTWDDLTSTLTYPQTAAYQDETISNITAYRYYRLWCTSSWTYFSGIYELYLYSAGTAPETLDISDSLSLSDNFILQTNPDTQSIGDSLSLHDSFIVQTNPDNQSLPDSVLLSDSWNINLFGTVITKFQTKLYTILKSTHNYATDLRVSFKSVQTYTTKLYTQLIKSNIYRTDLRVRTTSIDEVVLGTLTDFVVKLDGLNLPDIDYTTLNINLALNTTPSTATFTLARRHDNLDIMLNGTSSIITSENKIEVYDGTRKLFTGYISEINADSTRDVVNITASDCRLKMSRTSMELRYGGTWQADSNHNGIVDDDDTTEDIPFNRPDYIKFEKNINTAFIEVMIAVGSILSGYDDLPFPGSYVPEYVKSEKNYTDLIDELIRQTANCNWYIDENERLRFQKVGLGDIKTLPLASLNIKRHPYDLIVDNIQLNRPSSSYAKSLVIKRGKDLKDTYFLRVFSGWTYDILFGQNGVFYEFNKFLNSLQEKSVFVFQQNNTDIPNPFGDEYVGMNIPGTISYSLYDNGKIWYWTYPVMYVQWVKRILNKLLPDITVGSGLPKKTVYLNSYGKKVSNQYYSEEIKVQSNPNLDYMTVGDKQPDKAYFVRIKDENYDQSDFCLDIANFELSQNNIMTTTAVLSFLLDAYEYYNMSFSDLVNLSNTIQLGIYNNANGFPLNINSISINCASRVVNLNVTNYGKSWYAKTTSYLLNYIPPSIEYLKEKIEFTYTVNE